MNLSETCFHNYTCHDSFQTQLILPIVPKEEEDTAHDELYAPIRCYLEIINRCWRNNVLPSELELAGIVTIYKKKIREPVV